MESLFGELSTVSIVIRLVIVALLTAFVPMTTVTFFRYMMDKKVLKYYKALGEMGINSSRKVTDTFSPQHFYLPVTFATALCFIALLYFAFAEVWVAPLQESLLLSGGYFGESNKPLIKRGISVIQYAFFGGFLWSAYNLIRRLNNYDLMPNVYYNMAVRIVMASVLALLVSFLVGDDASLGIVNLKNWMPGLAFLIGIFPDRGLNYLARTFRRVIESDTVTNKHLALQQIEGINSFHKERLEENGIDNAQNLAAASLTQLLIETPFEARLLLDWIGQAKLLCLAKEDIDGFREMGIRTVYDFFRITKSVDDMIKDAQQYGIPPAKMDNVFHQCIHDNGIRALVVFQNGLNAPAKDGEIVRPPVREDSHIPDETGGFEQNKDAEYLGEDVVPKDPEIPVVIHKDDDLPVG